MFDLVECLRKIQSIAQTYRIKDACKKAEVICTFLNAEFSEIDCVDINIHGDEDEDYCSVTFGLGTTEVSLSIDSEGIAIWLKGLKFDTQKFIKQPLDPSVKHQTTALSLGKLLTFLSGFDENDATIHFSRSEEDCELISKLYQTQNNG